MSKMDALRAMREARYEQAARAATPKPKPKPNPKSKPESKPESKPTEPDASEGLCGHRAISGRTCTREAGHAAKSHRYS